MGIIAVAVVITIPTCLHANLFTVVDLETQIIDGAVDPNVGSVAVRSLLEGVVGINIYLKSEFE